MSLGLTIYPIQFFNLFISGATIIAGDRLSFKSNTTFLKDLKQSGVLQRLPPGIKVEYEEGCVTTESLRTGEPLMVGYSTLLKPWLSNYLKMTGDLNDWDCALVEFLIALPPSYPVIFNWE